MPLRPEILREFSCKGLLFDMYENRFPEIRVQPMSSSRRLEQFPEQKYYLNPTYVTLGHDLRINLARDFTDLDFPSASRELFVISVDLRSRVCRDDIFCDMMNFVSPLSLKALHLARFKFFNNVMYCEFAIAPKV